METSDYAPKEVLTFTVSPNSEITFLYNEGEVPAVRVKSMRKGLRVKDPVYKDVYTGWVSYDPSPNTD